LLERIASRESYENFVRRGSGEKADPVPADR
jgi:hypothetical protein